MGRVSIPAGLAAISSVPFGRVMRYAESRLAEHGPTIDHLQLFMDAKSVGPDSRRYGNIWNKRACVLFVPHFIQHFPEYNGHEALVESVFMTHLRQLENQFNKFNSQNGEESRQAAIGARKQQSRRKVRCVYILHERGADLLLKLCARRIEILDSCRDGTGGVLDTLAQVARDQMDWRCCSGDETDGEGEHAITELPWRSERIRKLFRLVDLAGLARRFPDGLNATTGEFPKVRYDPAASRPRRERTKETYRSGPPPGLPENFYDRQWLRDLDDLEKLALNMTAKVEITKLPQDFIE